MFSRNQRFTTRRFDRFFHDRRKTRIKTTDLVWFIKHNTAEFRVAVVVSKKNIKSAVKRNKIRRQLREIIKLHLLPYCNTPQHIMCLYQQEFKMLDRQKIITDLEKVLNPPVRAFRPKPKKTGKKNKDFSC